MPRKTIDFEQINGVVFALYPGVLSEWLPGGRLDGAEYKAKNPVRDDQNVGSFSINVNSGIWKDFASGEGGNDPISLYAYINSLKMGEAAKDLKARYCSPDYEPPPVKEQVKKERWKTILPVPDGAPLPPTHFKDAPLERIFKWFDPTGNLIGYTARVTVENDRQVVPLTYCENPKDKYRSWKYQGFDKPRPLFNQHHIFARSDSIIIVVEGEKCAENLQNHLKEKAVVTTSGSSASANSANWKILKDRKVITWRDNDIPGIKYESAIIENLKGVTDKIKIVDIPKDKPKGWDCADMIEDNAEPIEIIKFITGHVTNYDPQDAPPLPDEPGQDIDPGPEEPAEPSSGDMYENPLTDLSMYPFRFLGYDGDNHYYLPSGSEQIYRIKGTEHDENHLTVLADRSFWEKHFKYKDSIDWKFIKRVILHDINFKRGIIYQPNNLRNVGVWYDAGRIIIHVGGCLWIDGKSVKVSQLNSKYIYEKRTWIEDQTYKPLVTKEAKKMIDLFEQFSFNKMISARLLAGFMVSGLCGDTVKWKPHLWLCGRQGCGKSTILRYINSIMGRCIHKVSAGTTEAGLRQMINGTSFPISYDEAEATQKDGKIRMDKIIELMRSSASPENEFTVKGSSANTPVFFMVRSAFILASINDPLQLAQDKARTVSLEMHENKEKWEKLEPQINDLLTPEYCGMFRARIFTLIPVILKNMAIFIRAVRDELDSQRYGDVYGVLLGGAYAFFSNKVITLDDAKEWVSEKDWEEQREVKEQRDELNCINTIFEKIVLIETKNRSLAELTNIISMSKEQYNSILGEETVDVISWREARDTLRRHGIMNTETGVIISNTNSQIRKTLRETPWENNWAKILKRIPGASGTAPKVFEIGKSSQRGTFIHFEDLKKIIELPDYDKNKGF